MQRCTPGNHPSRSSASGAKLRRRCWARRCGSLISPQPAPQWGAGEGCSLGPSCSPLISLLCRGGGWLWRAHTWRLPRPPHRTEEARCFVQRGKWLSGGAGQCRLGYLRRSTARGFCVSGICEKWPREQPGSSPPWSHLCWLPSAGDADASFSTSH